MTLTIAIALWGASVSTALSLLQLVIWLRARPRIQVGCQLAFSPAPSETEGAPRGTVISVRRGRDVLDEEVLAAFHVANDGDKALQISAVLIESVTGAHIHVTEVVPDPLPTVVEPRTAVDVTIQKEFIDMTDGLVFLGVVDALGRRYPVPASQARAVAIQCWKLPSRVGIFVRRDDPDAPPIRAFQSGDKVRLSTRAAATVSHRRRRPIETRPLSLSPGRADASPTTLE